MNFFTKLKVKNKRKRLANAREELTLLKRIKELEEEQQKVRKNIISEQREIDIFQKANEKLEEEQQNWSEGVKNDIQQTTRQKS